MLERPALALALDTLGAVSAFVEFGQLIILAP
jgi:hypothetical protein